MKSLFFLTALWYDDSCLGRKTQKEGIAFMRKLKENLHLLREEITPLEYLLWWAVRVCMLVYIIRQVRQAQRAEDYVIPMLNVLGSFSVFLARMIFPRGSTLGKLSYRAQKYITLMVFAGSFIGNYLYLYDINNPLHYDWILHAVSGVTITMLVYHLLLAMTDGDPLAPKVVSCCSMGFSFFIMVAWEIMEFCGDFLFGDNNQKYDWTVLLESDPIYPLFSRGAPQMRQLPLLDTMADLLLAFVATLLTGVALYFVLRRKAKKANG